MQGKSKYQVKFSTRGRITIPAALRRELGIQFPCKVLFDRTRGGIKLTLVGSDTVLRLQALPDGDRD